MFICEGLLAGIDSSFCGLDLELSSSLAVWVELLHQSFVLERVLLGLVMGTDRSLNLTELALDLIGVNDSGKVGAGHHVSGHGESFLDLGSLGPGAEDGIELFESVLGEDDESSDVTTWGELKKVDSVDVAGLNSDKVSSGLLNKTVLFSINNERSFSHRESGVLHFANSGSCSLRSSNAGHVCVGTEVVKRSKESLGGSRVE